MTCREFLARYSEYLDERVGPVEAERWRSHAMTCRSCARYDRVLRDGLERVRDLPDIEPSSDFLPRLQHRLYHLDDRDLEPGNRASGGSAAVALAVAAVLTLLAWSPLIRSQVGESGADEELDGAEARGVQEVEPTAPREVPSLSPSAVVPYRSQAWTGGLSEHRRMVLGRDVMLDRLWRSQDRVGTFTLSWLRDVGRNEIPAGFRAAGFATASGFELDDVSGFFGSSDFAPARVRSVGFGRNTYSPLLTGPPAFGSGEGQWITMPADLGYVPAAR